MWLTIIEILLKGGLALYNFFGAKKENYKWMVESLEVVRKKKMERARYIIESEQRQIDELNQRWNEIEKAEEK